MDKLDMTFIMYGYEITVERKYIELSDKAQQRIDRMLKQGRTEVGVRGFGNLYKIEIKQVITN